MSNLKGFFDKVPLMAELVVLANTSGEAVLQARFADLTSDEKLRLTVEFDAVVDTLTNFYDELQAALILYGTGDGKPVGILSAETT